MCQEYDRDKHPNNGIFNIHNTEYSMFNLKSIFGSKHFISIYLETAAAATEDKTPKRLDPLW